MICLEGFVICTRDHGAGTLHIAQILLIVALWLKVRGKVEGVGGGQQGFRLIIEGKVQHGQMVECGNMETVEDAQGDEARQADTYPATAVGPVVGGGGAEIGGEQQIALEQGLSRTASNTQHKATP